MQEIFLFILKATNEIKTTQYQIDKLLKGKFLGLI